MGARTRGSPRRETDGQRLRRFSDDERATRPAGVVTPGCGADFTRVAALRVKWGLPVPRPVAGVDDADLIDRDGGGRGA